MIAYVDSSVTLRFVLEQPGQLQEIASFDLVTSLLTEVECLRAVDNARLRGEMADDEYDARRGVVYAKLRGMRRSLPSRSILTRAGDALLLPLKTLDAIHLATAMMLRDRGSLDLVFATHDRPLGRAASALGFPVIGV
jgi:predicted nucleic acid-binding protein